MDDPPICGEVLLVPWGVESHLTPFIYVARRILKRGISCTLLLEEQGRRALERSFIKYDSLENAVGFSVKFVPTFAAESAPSAWGKWGVACEPVLQELLQYQQDGGKGPKCMIVDQFAGWTNRWAKELTIPRYVFCLSAATFMYWMYRYSTLIRKDNLLERVHEDPILDLPGAPKIRLSEAESSAVNKPEIFSSIGDTLDDAAGILINTFYALEAPVIDDFHSQLDAVRTIQTKGYQQSKVLPIGPLAHSKSIEHVAFGSPENDFKCIQWLDERSPGSVLYISFGSLGTLSELQILELANALEATQVKFLWILLAPSHGFCGFSEWSDVAKVLPTGFQDRTKGHGLVHPSFAPQLQILEHPATGTFLTHCGWNSAMESIYRGIPLIGWPRQNDQLLCCRVLERTGVLARIRPEMTRAANLLKSDELERAIRTWAMEGPERTKLRERALVLQHQAREAVSPSGSSYQTFENFIQNIFPKE